MWLKGYRWKNCIFIPSLLLNLICSQNNVFWELARMSHLFHPSLNQLYRQPRNSTLRSLCCRDIPHLDTQGELYRSSLHPWGIWLLLLWAYFCLRSLLCPAWYRPSCRRRQPGWNPAVFPATTLFLFSPYKCTWILMLVLVHRVLRKH